MFHGKYPPGKGYNFDDRKLVGLQRYGSAMSNVDLNSVRAHVEILRYVKAQKAKLTELEKGSRGEVEAAMGGNDVGLLDGEPAVHWTHFKESRLNQAALKEDHPDLIEQYRTLNEKRRFEVL